jgi:RNA polymerase sigma-70 factor (ECF subfamily)
MEAWSADAKSDTELVQHAREGQAEAFEALARRHQAGTLRLVGRILPHREDAEDVVQEAIVAAFRQMARFRGEASFATWLGRIALHKAMRVARRGKREVEAGCEDEPESQASEATEALVVRQAVARLPERLRVPVVLRFYEGLEGHEIAELLGCRESTVWTRLYRGLQRLREELGGGDPQ